MPQVTASKTSDLSLSPSVLHDKLMNALKPSMTYAGGDVKAWQQTFRQKVMALLGWDQMPTQRCDLNVRTLWTREHELGTITKLVYTAEPGADVPCYLCLPENAKPPYTLFICLQGHSTGMHNSIGVAREDETQTIEVRGDRDFGLACMKRGIAALCIEQRSFGERREQAQETVAKNGCQDAVVHALMLGRTLVGERIFDVDRGIDLLETRDDIDMNKLGLLGNSGGGTVTLWGSGILDRVKFAMPSCATATFRDSIMKIAHCTDNYIPHILKYGEIYDVMGLFAPKPMVVVAGEQDEIFPITAVRESYEATKKIYTAAGAQDKCKLVIGPEGHRFYADQAWDAMLPLLEQA